MRTLVLSENYSCRYNCVREIFLQDLFEGKDAIFFGPGYPGWEDGIYSAKELMHLYEADLLFVSSSKWVRHWITEIAPVSNSVIYMVDYYPRDSEKWRNDFLIEHKFNAILFPQQHMVDRCLKMHSTMPVKVFHLPHGVNTDLFKPDLSINKDINISAVMSINTVEYPNRDRILAAIERVKFPAAFLRGIRSWRDQSLGLEKYINLLQRSKLGMQSCDRYGSVAIKHFEIMASGAVLFTDHAHDFQKLGFQGGVHFIGYRNKKVWDIPRLIKEALRDTDRLKEISTNGVEFINQRHTNRHRAEELWTFMEGL